jgi:acyl dehydratase
VSWEDAQERVGQQLGLFSGADEVAVSDFRRQLEVFAWDCPLHYDAEIARQHGYRTVVAPVSMHMSLALPPYWRPGAPRPESVEDVHPLDIPIVTNAPGEGDVMVDTELAVDYHAPVYPGDRISAVSTLESVKPKTTRVGVGAFFVVESSYRNQDGELVARDRLTLYRYTPHAVDS